MIIRDVLLAVMGPLTGGRQCRISILRNGNVAYLCHLFSLMSHDSVQCHYIFSPHVACHFALCRMLNSRNAPVVLSILGVKSHSYE